MIRVLVIEDVPMFRTGLRWALEQAHDFRIISETTDLADILNLAQVEQPDAILLHEGLSTASTLALVTRLHQEVGPCGLFVWATSGTQEQVFNFLLAGAAAYERRSLSLGDLVDKLRRVGQGEYLIYSEAIWPDLAAAPVHLPSSPMPDQQGSHIPESAYPLSPRELQIVNYMARGMSNKQIEKALHISDQTMKNHITAVLRTLEVADRTSAVLLALRRGWITLASIEKELPLDTEQTADEDPAQPPRRKARSRQKALSPVHQASAIHYRLQKMCCGKVNCRRCHEGIGHGPYWYAYQVITGRTVRPYVGKTLPEGASEHVVKDEITWAVFTQLFWRFLPLSLSLASSWKLLHYGKGRAQPHQDNYTKTTHVISPFIEQRKE